MGWSPAGVVDFSTSSRQVPVRAVDCKPGSVPGGSCDRPGEDHSSRPAVTDGLEHSDPDTAAPRLRAARFRWAIFYGAPI